MAPGRTPESRSEESLDAAALNAVDEAARAIAGLLDLEDALQLIELDRITHFIAED